LCEGIRSERLASHKHIFVSARNREVNLRVLGALPSRSYIIHNFLTARGQGACLLRRRALGGSKRRRVVVANLVGAPTRGWRSSLQRHPDGLRQVGVGTGGCAGPGAERRQRARRPGRAG